MMNIEILEDVSACNDQMILKGKRTKRLRPSSSTSSSGGGGSAAEFNYNSLVSSPTTSSGISTSTEEDEDMANCLILLAQGGFSTQIKPEETNFSSRKFTEMATTTNCKVGIYVYECKTCSRTFPSFQALGGHRASHKKPKLTTADSDQKKSPPPPPRDHEEEDTPVPPSSAQFPSKNCNMERNKSKIHECSICGSEFTSGQALGGHMRRHRSATNTTVRSSNDDIVIGEKTRNMLALDLNLPAPPEDDRPETKFHQFSSNPPPHLAFSASALVDCHY